MGHETAVLSRRGLLTGGAALSAAAAMGVATAAPADAAVSAVGVTFKKVYQYKVVRYRYNSRTHVTTVTKSTKVKVVARFAGSTVYLRNSKGTWVPIPYVWSSKKKALVYSRYLHIQQAAAAARAAAAAKAAANPTSGVRVVTPKSFGVKTPYHSADWARHLLRRAGFGPTPADLASVKALGYSGWLERQLSPSSVDDSACNALLTRLPNQALPVWKVRYGIRNGDIDGYQQQQSVLTDFTTRAMWSKRQLLTVMEDFWGNHFNVTVPSDSIDESRAHYAYTIRTHALGKFSDLLRATSKHPSMLTYLNNRDSTRDHPNENQGRELLELHTVGVDGGYGEVGVINAARILTGLGVDNESGEFEYKPWDHWTGPVKVLGFTHANTSETGGEKVADALFSYLARHPVTAKRIALKLAVRFVSDTPSAALVNLLAATYTKYDTAIVPVLRVLFSSGEFATSIGGKMHRPFEHIIATARLMQIQAAPDNLDAPRQLLAQAESAGHNPFGQPFPTGQPDTADAWLSTATTLVRWNNVLNVVGGGYPSDVVRPPLLNVAVGPTLPTTHGALVDQVATQLFGRALSAAHKTAILAFLNVAADRAVSSSSPAVSYNLANFVAVLLDSPYQTLR